MQKNLQAQITWQLIEYANVRYKRIALQLLFLLINNLNKWKFISCRNLFSITFQLSQSSIENYEGYNF